MGDLYLAEQSAPGTPSSGNGVIWVDSTTKTLFTIDSTGRKWGRTFNASVASQAGTFASDIYVTNSNILVPSFGVQAKTVIRWMISATKTAAGTATPVYSIRIGANATTADTARLQLTGSAQTAAADTGILEIMLTFIDASASANIRGTAAWAHNGAATGFASDDAGAVTGTSAAFDATSLAGSYIGLSINGGASAAWTVGHVLVEGIW